MVAFAWDGDYEFTVDSSKKYSLSIQGTARPKPTTTGYSVSMAADQTVAAGETVSIPVTVASSEKKITGFNAYDMTFTYNPAALTLNTASDAAANLTVEDDNNGTVRVRRYGETVPLGEALTLDFTAKKGAASTVTLTEAKFDLDANSINFDAPAATITDGDTKVTGLWNVTLPEGFQSASGVNTVEDGKDFTFTAPDAHYDYTLNVTTNGKTDQVTMKGNKGGFYWAGAYVCDDFLLIGTDDGASGYTTGKPSLLSFNPKTGELLSSYKMNVTGDIRSSITHYNGKYYFTSKGGYFFEASVDAEGNIEDVRTLKLYNYADDPANPAMSTCTPTIYNGRAYIGISGTAQFGAYSGHNLTVIDIPNWEIAYTVRTHGYPQTSGVLTTAYKEETGCVYVYFFDNFTPGKLRVLEDRPGQTEVSLKTMETYTASGKSENYTTPYNIFTPSGAQAQYAICSPIMDEYGTIYFKNDSAYLMAVGSTIERIEVTKLPDKTTYNVKDTFDPTGMQVTAYYANGKTRDITDYVTWSETPLTANDTDFQITFPYAMYQNRENSDTLEMEYGVHCDKPMTTLTLTIEDTTEVKYGDVNGDGKVASTDAAIVYRYANGKYQLSANQLLAADVNGDGVVNSTDAALIYRMANGKLLKFPVEKEKQSEQTTD